MNIKTRPEVRKSFHKKEIAEPGAEEELYDELYAETYQGLHTGHSSEHNNPRQKKPKLKTKQLKHRSVSEMIL